MSRIRPVLVVTLALTAGAMAVAEEVEPRIDAYVQMPLCLRVEDDVDIRISLYNRSETEPFRFRGGATGAAGALEPTGEVGLAVERLVEDAVVATRSLGDLAASAEERGTAVCMGPGGYHEWAFTLPVRRLGDSPGACRLRLRIGKRTWASRIFRIGASLDAPNWIELSYTTPRDHYILGEAISVAFVMRNAGKETFSFDEGGDYRGASRHLRWLFRGATADGVEAVDPTPDEPCFGGLGMADPALSPGETYEKELPLLAYLRFPAAGRYTITAYQALGFGEPTAGLEDAGYGAYAEGGSFQVEIVWPDTEERRALLATMLSLEDEAERRRRFALLGSEVFLDDLTVLIEAEADPARIEALLDGIGSIMTVRATELLIALARDPRGALRVGALRRLSWRMPDPRDTGKATRSNPFATYSSAARRRDVAAAWDERLRPRLLAVLDEGLRAENPDEVAVSGYILGALAETGPAEWLAAAADRVAPEVPIGAEAAACVKRLGEAANVLAQVGAPPVAVSAGASPGRFVVWANMIRATPAHRGEGWEDGILQMLATDDSTVRMAAIRWLPEDFERRAEIPWRALFLDPDRQVWWHAIQVARQDPPEGLARIVERCLSHLSADADREVDLRALLSEIGKR